MTIEAWKPTELPSSCGFTSREVAKKKENIPERKVKKKEENIEEAEGKYRKMSKKRKRLTAGGVWNERRNEKTSANTNEGQAEP